ncbi:hypothetical protein CDD83_9924 [Cordyceps sp. RAO-2017]|nr:hypothetical protein CDD83_9924 [Cordyceps sp. RAO-2017]
MHLQSVSLTAALVLAALVAADPEPERPRIYFPRQVKREYVNGSDPGSDDAAPAGPDDGSSRSPGLVDGLVSDLLDSSSTTDSLTSTSSHESSNLIPPSLLPVVGPPPTSDGEHSHVPTTPDKDRLGLLPGKGSSGGGIVIAPTGIVTSTAAATSGHAPVSTRPSSTTGRDPKPPKPVDGPPPQTEQQDKDKSRLPATDTTEDPKPQTTDKPTESPPNKDPAGQTTAPDNKKQGTLPKEPTTEHGTTTPDTRPDEKATPRFGGHDEDHPPPVGDPAPNRSPPVNETVSNPQPPPPPPPQPVLPGTSSSVVALPAPLPTSTQDRLLDPGLVPALLPTPTTQKPAPVPPTTSLAVSEIQPDDPAAVDPTGGPKIVPAPAPAPVETKPTSSSRDGGLLPTLGPIPVVPDPSKDEPAVPDDSDGNPTNRFGHPVEPDPVKKPTDPLEKPTGPLEKPTDPLEKPTSPLEKPTDSLPPVEPEPVGTAPTSSSRDPLLPTLDPKILPDPLGPAVPDPQKTTAATAATLVTPQLVTDGTAPPKTLPPPADKQPPKTSDEHLPPAATEAPSSSDPLLPPILPGPSNSTSSAPYDESSVVPIPAPIPVKSTGQAPPKAQSTSSSSAPSTQTTTSATDGLLPDLTPVLPLGPPTSTSSLAATTSTSLLSATTSQPASEPPTDGTTGKVPEVPVANTTTSVTPTTTLAPDLVSTSAGEVPVVNGTSPATTSSVPPDGAVPLLPTSSTGVKTLTSAAPETSSVYRYPTKTEEAAPPPLSSSHSSLARPPKKPTPVATVAHPADTVTSTESEQPPVVQHPPPTATPAAPPPPQTTYEPCTTCVPRYIVPSKEDPVAPGHTRDVNIGIKGIVSKSYATDPRATADRMLEYVSRLLPAILAISLKTNETSLDQVKEKANMIKVNRVEPCELDSGWGPANFNVSFPDYDGSIDRLELDILLPNSHVHQNNTNNETLAAVLQSNLEFKNLQYNEAYLVSALQLIGQLASSYNISTNYCLSLGAGSGARQGGGGGSGGGGDSDSKTNDPFKGGGKPVNAPVALAIAGGVGASILYGAAMFLVARRYKRKRQSHRRSNSVTNSQVPSDMAQASVASPALMGGALAGRDYFHHGSEGRDSRGSGRSGMGNSGRTANISAPVAAENSLGWN